MANPQVFLLPLVLVLLLHFSCFLQLAETSTSNFTDQSALFAIQSKLTYDPTKTVLGGDWTTNTSFCNWTGVSCSKRRQRVRALDLSFMGLQGTIAPHVGNLSFLVSLDLRNNSFLGFVPNEIAHLHRLKVLFLHSNQLEGNIPPTLYHCQKLEIISLAINKLGGRIPREFGFLPRLKELFLSTNDFKGGIPPTLGNISTLETLSISYNDLTGSIPSSLLNLSSLVTFSVYQNSISGSFLGVDLCLSWPRIQFLSLTHNHFSGHLPSFGNCSELVGLSLSFNKFIGKIPADIGNLQNLEGLYLGFNSLSGTIPPTIGNLSNLKSLGLRQCNIEGTIPSELGQLSKLVELVLGRNGLSGHVPPEIFNMSSLQAIEARDNALSGKFPASSSVVSLPKVEFISFSNNSITGNLPLYFSNFTKLSTLNLRSNLLYGPIPKNFGSLNHLEVFHVGRNQLTGDPGVPELEFLSSLFNCPSLELLILSQNPLNGIIPNSFGNYSSSLQSFFIQACQIKGHIPNGIDSLKNLTFLLFANNNLSGSIPPSIGGLEKLQRLYIGYNNFEGFIPDELCLLRNLGELSLESNKISRSIPSCIGNLNLLQTVLLNSNRLTSVPVTLWDLENLRLLDLSINSFSGDLPPQLTKLNAIEMINLSQNQITGNIPRTIGTLQTLRSLNLSNNLFIGSVPQSFGDKLKGLELLDLSSNNLSGAIPKSLETLKFLKFLNLSANELSGEIPFGGQFVNFTAESFRENKALCGRPKFGVSPCRTHRTQNSKKIHDLLGKYVLPAIAATLILIALSYTMRWYRKRNIGPIPRSVEEFTTVEHTHVTYQELRGATNDFCESNLLGVGGFGSVYKGILSNGTVVAVKVLNLEMEDAVKSFDAECKVWRTIRHRNLVKVLTTCSSPDVRALVLQYMSNGSLEKWLYSHNYCLNILRRVSILIDVASALEYLHYGQAEVVVHCDVKPGNILLDEEMVAYVGDFGLAKILANNKDATQTRTIGTLGYVAPEYGSAGTVSKRGDVYSFGIMLLELMVRKKPTDEMFAGEVTLRQWVNVSLPNSVLEVVDAGLLSIEEGKDMNAAGATEDIFLSIMEIGLRCSEEVAGDRMDIKDVVPKLMKIKFAIQR